MKLIACGGLRVDYLITHMGEVRLRQMGGNAIYAAVGARLWLDQVHILARIGENYPAEWLEELERCRLRTGMIRSLPGAHEMRTFYAYLDFQTRDDRDPARHFARVGHPLPPELRDYVDSTVVQHDTDQADPLILRAADIPADGPPPEAVHLAPLGPASQRELTLGCRRRGAGQITVDPGEVAARPEHEEHLRAVCRHADAFLPSEMEINSLFGRVDLREAAERLGEWGAPVVVIKRGARGALLYEREMGRFTDIPAYPAKVVDVTGAGDSFGGGFAVGLRQTGDPCRAALMGTVSASFVVEGYGSLYALYATREMVEARLKALAAAVP